MESGCTFTSFSQQETLVSQLFRFSNANFGQNIASLLWVFHLQRGLAWTENLNLIPVRKGVWVKSGRTGVILSSCFFLGLRTSSGFPSTLKPNYEIINIPQSSTILIQKEINYRATMIHRRNTNQYLYD